MFPSTHSRLLPLPVDFTAIEVATMFVLATAGLQLFLFAIAAVIEFSRPDPKRNFKQIRAEMLDSLSNPPAAILTTMAWDIFVRPHTPSAVTYGKPHADMPSWGRLALEWLAIFLAADFYIYWEHRMMHTKFMYPRIHKIHHTYHVPTAFAGFANHPIEAVLFSLGSLWIQLFVAVHPVSHALFGLFGATWTILSHDDRSPHDAGFHYQHHFNPNRNFGAFTVVWDNVFGTRHVNPSGLTYPQEVEQAKRRAEKRTKEE